MPNTPQLGSTPVLSELVGLQAAETGYSLYTSPGRQPAASVTLFQAFLAYSYSVTLQMQPMHYALLPLANGGGRP